MLMPPVLDIAVSKGRILDECLPLLAQAGIRPREDPLKSRKLIFETNRADVRLVVVRAADVPTYVAHGAADLGVAGKDVLMEYAGNDLYEPLNLGIARCRLVLAGREGAPATMGRRRVATKYVNLSRDYFADRGEQVEIIRLYGSMELAPVLGLADYIVDLVDTGKTLKANGLVELDTIARISSRVVVNKAAMKMRQGSIKPLIQQLAAAVGSS